MTFIPAWLHLSFVQCSLVLNISRCPAESRTQPPAPSHPSVDWAERSADLSEAEQSRVRGQAEVEAELQTSHQQTNTTQGGRGGARLCHYILVSLHWVSPGLVI